MTKAFGEANKKGTESARRCMSAGLNLSIACKTTKK